MSERHITGLAPIVDKLQLGALVFGSDKPVEGVYLIHLDSPLAHARHYLGWSENVAKRMDQHFTGHKDSSPMLKAALRAGISLDFVALWKDRGRDHERRLKEQKCIARVCPICRPERMARENRLARERKIKKRRRLASELMSVNGMRAARGLIQLQELPTMGLPAEVAKAIGELGDGPFVVGSPSVTEASFDLTFESDLVTKDNFDAVFGVSPKDRGSAY